LYPGAKNLFIGVLMGIGMYRIGLVFRFSALNTGP
jgi:hypothetical protein